MFFAGRGRLRQSQFALNGHFIRERLHMPSDESEACSLCSSSFLVVRGLAIARFVSLVIKLDGRKDGGVLGTDHKVVAHSVNAIVPLVKIEPLLYSQYARDLDLSKYDVLWKGLYEPVV